MEQASATLAAVHLAQAQRQAAQRGLRLPAHFVRADESRAKVTDISDGKVEVRTFSSDESPADLRARLFRDIEGATFVGKGDKRMVQQMLFKFEWIMKMAVDGAAAMDPKSGLTIDPAVQRAAIQGAGAQQRPVLRLQWAAVRAWLRSWMKPRAAPLLRERGAELTAVGASGDAAASEAGTHGGGRCSVAERGEAAPRASTAARVLRPSVVVTGV